MRPWNGPVTAHLVGGASLPTGAAAAYWCFSLICSVIIPLSPSEDMGATA